MDRYRVKLMRRASKDLDDIYRYVAKTLLEPKVALKLISRIEQAIYSLEGMPYRCAERKIGVYANCGYRQMFVENYIIVFRVDESLKTVLVVTVRYAHSQF